MTIYVNEIRRDVWRVQIKWCRDPQGGSGPNQAYSDCTFVYDAIGNMLNPGTQSMTWNIDNRFTSIGILGGGTAWLEYNYTRMRVKKNATTTRMTLFPFQGYEIAPSGADGVRLSQPFFSLPR